jgi:protein-tyrosine phosphatase
MMSDPTTIKIDFDSTAQRMTGVTVHGSVTFDVPIISQIAPNLWQGGCEDGQILPDFIKHLVSLYPWESYRVRHELDSVLRVRMYDSQDQTFEQIEELARWVNLCRKTGPVLVHCQAGLNRSSLVTARALMLEGKSANDAIATVRANRSPACLCNRTFEDYLRTCDHDQRTEQRWSGESTSAPA